MLAAFSLGSKAYLKSFSASGQGENTVIIVISFDFSIENFLACAKFSVVVLTFSIPGSVSFEVSFFSVLNEKQRIQKNPKQEMKLD